MHSHVPFRRLRPGHLRPSWGGTMSASSTQIDPRGPRFTASVTLVVFAVVLLTAPATAGIVLLAIQTAFFAIGAARGVQFTPTAYVFKKLVRPRLSAPDHL